MTDPWNDDTLHQPGDGPPSLPGSQDETVMLPEEEASGIAPSAPSGGVAAPAGKTLPPPSNSDPRVGVVVDGKYEVLAPLGAGGMATVYRARHRLLDKEVALKFIRPGDAQTAGFRDRFFREARLATELVHRNLVQTREFGEAEGEFFIVMDFCPGQTLRQVLKSEGPLPVARAASIADQILDALAEAHRLSIVHRDLKPDNLMLQGDTTKILDFGLAKVVTSDPTPGPGVDQVSRDDPTLQDSSGSHDGSLTQLGSVLGTPRYMSPEQAGGDPVDHRSDLYAVGLILYEMLAGRAVFEDKSTMALLRAHLSEPAPPLSLHADVDPALEAVVMRALEKERADRWGSAQAFRTALRDAIGPGGAPTPPTPPSRHGLLVAGAFVVLGGLAVVASIVSSGPPTPPPVPPTRSPATASSVTPSPDAEVPDSPDPDADVPDSPDPTPPSPSPDPDADALSLAALRAMQAEITRLRATVIVRATLAEDLEGNALAKSSLPKLRRAYGRELVQAKSKAVSLEGELDPKARRKAQRALESQRATWREFEQQAHAVLIEICDELGEVEARAQLRPHVVAEQEALTASASALLARVAEGGAAAELYPKLVKARDELGQWLSATQHPTIPELLDRHLDATLLNRAASELATEKESE